MGPADLVERTVLASIVDEQNLEAAGNRVVDRLENGHEPFQAMRYGRFLVLDGDDKAEFDHVHA